MHYGQKSNLYGRSEPCPDWYEIAVLDPCLNTAVEREMERGVRLEYWAPQQRPQNRTLLAETDMARRSGRARSAVTGKFVKKSYAKRHPRTTVIERKRRRK
jgi:hypothetical protein